MMFAAVSRGARLLCFVLGLSAMLAPPADAQDRPQDKDSLAELAQLTVQKGFKNIGLGDICDRLHIGTACSAYQLNAMIDPGESRTFGVPAGWQTSLNAVPAKGGVVLIIAEHDQHIGYAYLLGGDESLRAVIVGLSADGKTWRWKPGPANAEIAQRFAAEKAYWFGQIKTVQALPDRKD